MTEGKRGWTESMIQREGFALSRDLQWLLAADREALQHYFLIGEETNEDWCARLQRQIPIARFVPIARRSDQDLTVGVVLDDPVHPRGEVLIVFDDFSPCCGEIEAVYPTIDSWAREARKDIRERLFLRRCGRFYKLADWILRRFSRPPQI